MKIESTVMFLNVSAPFSVLNHLCTGEVEFQAVLAENKNGEMVLEDIDIMGNKNVVFAGNKIDVTGYKEYQEWTKKVNEFFNCDIDQLIIESAKAKINKASLKKYASKIQLPQNKKPNCNGCCC